MTTLLHTRSCTDFKGFSSHWVLYCNRQQKWVKVGKQCNLFWMLFGLASYYCFSSEAWNGGGKKKRGGEIWKKVEEKLLHKMFLFSRNSKITSEYYIRWYYHCHTSDFLPALIHFEWSYFVKIYSIWQLQFLSVISQTLFLVLNIVLTTLKLAYTQE